MMRLETQLMSSHKRDQFCYGLNEPMAPSFARKAQGLFSVVTAWYHGCYRQVASISGKAAEEEVRSYSLARSCHPSRLSLSRHGTCLMKQACDQCETTNRRNIEIQLGQSPALFWRQHPRLQLMYTSHVAGDMRSR